MNGATKQFQRNKIKYNYMNDTIKRVYNLFFKSESRDKNANWLGYTFFIEYIKNGLFKIFATEKKAAAYMRSI